MNTRLWFCCYNNTFLHRAVQTRCW